MNAEDGGFFLRLAGRVSNEGRSVMNHGAGFTAQR